MQVNESQILYSAGMSSQPLAQLHDERADAETMQRKMVAAETAKL